MAADRETTADEVPVAAFIQTEIERLHAFAAWWRAEHQADPESFPARLPLGEWHEQYQLWRPER